MTFMLPDKFFSTLPKQISALYNITFFFISFFNEFNQRFNSILYLIQTVSHLHFLFPMLKMYSWWPITSVPCMCNIRTAFNFKLRHHLNKLNLITQINNIVCFFRSPLAFIFYIIIHIYAYLIQSIVRQNSASLNLIYFYYMYRIISLFYFCIPLFWF